MCSCAHLQLKTPEECVEECEQCIADHPDRTQECIEEMNVCILRYLYEVS